MLNGGPRWAVKITHVPTGIEVVRDSNHFRNQHLTRQSAIRYLRSMLYQLEPKVKYVRIETYDYTDKELQH